MFENTVVWVVEDDDDLRASLVWLLESAGYTVVGCSSPRELLDNYDADREGVLLLDLQLPDMSGLELVRKLREHDRLQAFIVMSGHGDISSAVELMHEGAVEFLEKPFDHARLLECIEVALQRNSETRKQCRQSAELREMTDRLTPREAEVMQLVVEGMLTKQIASELGISVKTVEVHRSNVKRKMNVPSIVQLVRVVLSHTAKAS